MLDAMDHAEIRNVLSFYPYIIDMPANYGRVDEVFTQDAVFDAGPLGRHVGVPALIEYWSHSPVRAEALKKSKLLSHNVVNIHISEDADGTVRCLSRCLGVSTEGVATCMSYHDVMRRTDKGWRIAERRLEIMQPPTVTLREDVAQ
jgi:hypothetical protein